MEQIRRATAEDAEAIGEQRQRMFADSGQGDAAVLETMRAAFIPWVREKLTAGSYVGWLAEDAGCLIAGAGLWVMEFPPHFRDVEARRAYLLNFYVAPEARGRGLAGRLLGLAVAEARARGIRVVSLHASTMGRPVYERNGFVVSNEMMLVD